MIRSFRYPLYPTVAQEEVLTRWLGMCCDLYNGALQERRDAWRKQRRSVSLFDQQRELTEVRRDVPGWIEIPAKIARSALRRLDDAMKAFFRRCKVGEKPGYPRFRPKRRYDSFGLGGGRGKDPIVVRDSRVKIPRLGDVKFREYRQLRGTILDAMVRREAGKWFVIFQCDLGAAPEPIAVDKISEDRSVGIDVGLAALATLSSGEAIANPRHGARGAETLARRQRSLARKKRGSKSRRRAVQLVVRAHVHIKNQRLDTARKAAASLVSRFDLIAVEDLEISRMVHGNLSKSINDAGWRILIEAIACKAESAGKRLVKVDPRGTSQRCSGCGGTNAEPKTLSDRVHYCEHCTLVLDRDHNAALNILALGRSGVCPPVTQPVTAEGQQ